MSSSTAEHASPIVDANRLIRLGDASASQSTDRDAEGLRSADSARVRAAAVHSIVRAIQPMREEQWQRDLGIASAIEGGPLITGVSFAESKRRDDGTLDPAGLKVVLSSRDADNRAVVIKGEVSRGAFAFREKDWREPEPGSPLAALNATLATPEPRRARGQPDRGVDAPATPREAVQPERRPEPTPRAAKGADAPEKPTPESHGIKVWATRSELVAIGGGEKPAKEVFAADPRLDAALHLLAPAIRQPVYEAVGNRQVATKAVKLGAEGARELLAGFGAGDRRGLYLDPKAVDAIPGGPAALADVAAVNAARDAQAATIKAARAPARKAEAGRDR